MRTPKFKDYKHKQRFYKMLKRTFIERNKKGKAKRFLFVFDGLQEVNTVYKKIEIQ